MYPNTVPPNAGGPGGPPPYAPAEGDAGYERLVIVVGDNGLTLRFIKNLTELFSFRVVALIKPGPGAQRDELRKEAEANARLRLLERTTIDADTVSEAGLVEAYAVALMAQDDVANLHLALKISEMSRDLGDDTLPKLVIRMYNRQLRDRIGKLLGDTGGDEGRRVYVESDADMVARTYAAAALQQLPPGDIEVWGRRLYLTREPDPHAQAQWVVASGDQRRMELLPDYSNEADELAGTDREAGGDPVGTLRVLCLEPERSTRRFRPAPGAALRFTRRTMQGLRRTVDTKLRIAAVALIIIMSGGFYTLTHYNSDANKVRDGWDALYIITLMAGGGIDPEMKADMWVKITHAVVVVAGALVIPVITGAIVQALVARRYALAEGRIVDSVRDHVIVVGLGNLGTRVVEKLRESRIPVVAIEKDRDAVGIQAARAVGAQVLLGDASRPETLREAEVRYCRSLVAMTKQDSQNLETALSGLECNDRVRTVLRIYDPEFAALVRRQLNEKDKDGELVGVGDKALARGALQHASYSAPEVAAASFATALNEDEIQETIPVRGQMAYICEIRIGAGSELDGATAAEATAIGFYRLIAHRRAAENSEVKWHYAASLAMAAGDRLLLLATRPGLIKILQRCRADAAALSEPSH